MKQSDGCAASSLYGEPPAWPRRWRVFGLMRADPTDRTRPEIDVASIDELPSTLIAAGKTYIPVTLETTGDTLDFDPLFPEHDVNDVLYAFSIIEVDKPVTLTFGFDADWWAQWWVNGERLGRVGSDYKGPFPPQPEDHLHEITLNPGKNLLCARVVCGSHRYWLRAGNSPALLDEHLQRENPFWPSQPVAISPVEGLIEAFFAPKLNAINRWHCEGGMLTSLWERCTFRLAGRRGVMWREYDRLPIGEAQRLRVRLCPGKDMFVTVIADIDGCQQTLLEVRSDQYNDMEIAAEIHGKVMTRLKLVFSNESEAPHSGVVSLRWIMLEKDGVAWDPPPAPFEGMIVDEPVGRFSPGLGLLFGDDDLRQIRRIYESPIFEHVRKTDLAYAAEQFALDPTSLIRPYVLYEFKEFGRTSDAQYHTAHDGIALALVGLLTGNEPYLRQAARHAIAMAHIEHWTDGFLAHTPGAHWLHTGFAPNVATIKTSLLLDWTWDYLTPRGRAFVRKAIEEKGIAPLRPASRRKVNQGVRFCKGLILGSMAVADSFENPALQDTVRYCVGRINDELSLAVRPDGTFSEEMNYYGKGTMASTLVAYQAASRCLGVPIAELVTERMLPAMHYILHRDRRLNASMAAFCAGPLGDKAFAGQLVPMGLLQDFLDQELPASVYTSNRVEYIFFGLGALWAPKFVSRRNPPALQAFRHFENGGWVFGGSESPDGVRFSFESGLWDGHGHAWGTKNSLTLDAYGQRLLIRRIILDYGDARSTYTQKTTSYNTFAPSGRNQDSAGIPGRGAKTNLARNLGPLVVIESDNATAWSENVTQATRRMIFIHPGVMVVHDRMELDTPESGVQSWNSFQPWESLDDHRARITIGHVTVELTTLASGSAVTLTTMEDSVSGGLDNEAPVYRAAYTSAPARSHDLLTVIVPTRCGEALPGTVVINKLTRQVTVNVDSTTMVQLIARTDGCPVILEDVESDGELLVVVRRSGKAVLAGAFGATTLTTASAQTLGDGFLSWSTDETTL